MRKSTVIRQDLIPYYLFFILFTVSVLKNPFFWDTIQLASQHANFYFYHHLKLLFLPDSIDSGHIPAFGYTLAIFWKIFGRSLPVSHLFMLPFLIGIVNQAYRLLDKFISKQYLHFVLFLFLADPTFLAQASLVSPDIPLVYFFLLFLNAIFERNRLLKVLAVIGLLLISMRGWMIVIWLLFYDQYVLLREKGNRLSVPETFKSLKSYIPGTLIVLIYLILHYHAKGWIGYHKNSPWAVCFESVGFTKFIRNILIYGWRLIDFGRIAIWILFFISFRQFLKNIRTDSLFQKLVILSGILLFAFPFYMLLHRNLLGERYLIPVYMSFTLFVGYLFFEKTNFKAVFKRSVALAGIIILLGGNLIIYPDKIAQAWDSSLAYIPYFNLREESISYMKENNIKIHFTGSEFPNTAPFSVSDLIDSDEKFAEKNLLTNQYFLYSNVFNDISDQEYAELHNQWTELKTFKKCGVYFILYKNPD